MAGDEVTEAKRASRRAAEGARKLGPFALAVVIQAAVLACAVFVVVLGPELDEDPAFKARKKVYLPQKQLEHKTALAEFQNAASSPLMKDRVATEAMVPDSMPSLPEMPASDFNPIERNPMAMRSDAMLGRSGVLGALQGLETESSNASLFGIEDSGRRIVILFDNSATVWNKAAAAGVTAEAFVRELAGLIDGLNANTLFGIVPFARQVGTFRDFMVAASARNKARAKAWVAENVRATRKDTALAFAVDGIQGALEVGFQLEPDVMFVVADGDFQRNATERVSGGDVPWDEVRRTLRRSERAYGADPRIHFIGFEVEADDADAIERIVRGYDGAFRRMGE